MIYFFDVMSRAFFLLLGLGLLGFQQPPRTAVSTKPNVLVVLCDDLNDMVETLGGHPQAQTPNLRRLMRRGVTFTNAHANNPVCSPSRASLWSGLYPHTTGFYGFRQDQYVWRENPVLKTSVTLFEQFKRNGYAVFGTGKIFHHDKPAYPLFTDEGSASRFGVPLDYGPFASNGKTNVAHPVMREPYRRTPFESFAPLSEVPSVPPDASGAPGYRGWKAGGNPFRYVSETDRDPMADEQSAAWAGEVLRQPHTRPFLLTVGFIRPHTPLHAPKRFFDRFPLEKIQLAPYLENDRADCAKILSVFDTTDAAVRVASTKFARLREAYGGLEGARRHLQAYLACVAYLDEQLGKILDALDQSPYASNTVVVFTSDHGFHLGEKDWVYKQTVWERSTRVPLVVVAPGISRAGERCGRPVALIDVYPTLVDLAGLPAQPNAAGNGRNLDGHSLHPLLLSPQRGTWAGPPVALSCISGTKPLGENEPGRAADQHFTVRSERYRYTRCSNGEEELYDHRTDPNEWRNLAADRRYRAAKAELKRHLLRMTGQANLGEN